MKIDGPVRVLIGKDRPESVRDIIGAAYNTTGDWRDIGETYGIEDFEDHIEIWYRPDIPQEFLVSTTYYLCWLVFLRINEALVISGVAVRCTRLESRLTLGGSWLTRYQTKERVQLVSDE